MRGFERLILLLLGLWLLFDLVSHIAAEIFWFQEVGYLSAFLTRLNAQFWLWAIATFTSAGFLYSNLALARRIQHLKVESERFWGQGYDLPSSQLSAESAKLRLRWLLPAVIVLSTVAAWLLLRYIQATLSLWQPTIQLPGGLPQIAFLLELANTQIQLWQLPLPIQIWQVVVVIGCTLAIIAKPQFWLGVFAGAISLLFGSLLAGNWNRVLQFLHPISFNRTEPLFERDISFYIFSLPIWELLEFWLFGLFLFSIVAVTLIYLQSGDSLSQGWSVGFSRSQRRHLDGNGTLLMSAVALHYWLRRYRLLYSTEGVSYGASYTAVNWQLPIYTCLSLLAMAIAGYLLWRVIFFSQGEANFKRVPFPPRLVYGLIIYVTVAAITGSILPAAVNRLIVQPNEIARERPFIERTIALTRQAFALDQIEAQTFNPTGELTKADLQANDLTIDNIRLWDIRPLLQTNRQLQQIRLYYSFPDADFDRYTLKTEPAPTSPQTTRQQVLIAARELDYSEVPQQGQTWVNEHLVYTHGYGFTLSPVNTVGPGGLPDYFVRDIGTEADDGTLQTSSEAVRASVPTETPRIYYGEIANTYVMTPTRVQEFDYPSGDENVYNVYDGRGGIAIGAWWRRLLFSQYLKDWQMLFTRDFTPETKLLFRRNISERIRAIAPFLRYDNEPYLVAADAGDTQTQSYLYWVIDAYTTSDRYPYSDPGKYDFNYIRNSVKVVVDAYNGTVNFYVADSTDPIINSLAAIFPGMFRPLSSMPAALISHIRYPLDFFSSQSEQLLTYHMTDPQVFYNREDQWRIPNEIYANEPQPVEPYFLIMKLPTAETEEFILLSPFTPIQRNNLIAWLSARSDGDNYGKLLLYEFPKQLLIYGPEQIEARINQDPVISQQISLWNRQGSRAIQGNLLVIPIEQSLLYVEPIYLEAEQTSLPTFVRVIVAYENRIVMAETLEQALEGIFAPAGDTEAPAIIRPVEELGAPPQQE